MGPIETSIRQKLHDALTIDHLEIMNETSLHHGHAGKPAGAETHFKIALVSKDFEGLSRVQRHRKVFELLQDLMDNPIHALALDLTSNAIMRK